MFGISPIELLGLAAGACTAFTSLPQSYRILKTRDAESVSLATFIMFFMSSVFWLIYGFMANSFSIVFWSVISLISSGSVIILKIMDMQKNKKEV